MVSNDSFPRCSRWLATVLSFCLVLPLQLFCRCRCMAETGCCSGMQQTQLCDTRVAERSNSRRDHSDHSTTGARVTAQPCCPKCCQKFSHSASTGDLQSKLAEDQTPFVPCHCLLLKAPTGVSKLSSDEQGGQQIVEQGNLGWNWACHADCSAIRVQNYFFGPLLTIHQRLAYLGVWLN